MNLLYEELKEKYMLRTPKSNETFQRIKRRLPGGDTRSTVYHSPYPITASKAYGSKLYDLDSNTYIDFLNNYTSLIHGHAQQEIQKSISEALQKGTCTATLLEEQIKLAEALYERIPTMENIRFCNSGTEATMFAVRAARAYTKRAGLVKIEGGYHGTQDEAVFSCRNIPQNIQSSMVDSQGVPYNLKNNLYEVPFNNLEAMERVLKNSGDRIGAIIIEPVMGAAGVIPASKSYLRGVRELANKYNVVLIFDEVQTFRISYGGAQEVYNVKPDLTTLAKIIGGGLPVGAFGGKKEIMGMFDPSIKGPVLHGGTYNGNRLSMAAGLTSVNLLDKASIAYINKLGHQLKVGMEKVANRYSMPIKITISGSLLAVHFLEKTPKGHVEINDRIKCLENILHLDLLNQGIYTAPRGTWNISTVMTEHDVKTALSAFSYSIERMAKYI